jgi:NAD/NADP transhydrogenase beta subunit
MTEAFEDYSQPLPGLAVALTIALAGFSCALIGLALDRPLLIITGIIVGASGSMAVNGLADAVRRRRRRATRTPFQ